MLASFFRLEGENVLLTACRTPLLHCISKEAMWSTAPVKGHEFSLHYYWPEVLQVNLAWGSHILLMPWQLLSSLLSSQSLSPSQRQRSGIHVPSARQWNSSLLHSTGGNTEGKSYAMHCYSVLLINTIYMLLQHSVVSLFFLNTVFFVCFFFLSSVVHHWFACCTDNQQVRKHPC